MPSNTDFRIISNDYLIKFNMFTMVASNFTFPAVLYWTPATSCKLSYGKGTGPWGPDVKAMLSSLSFRMWLILAYYVQHNHGSPEFAQCKIQ